MSEEVESKKPDYLEVDEGIPGQNYVCLSFLSPETFIQNKDALYVFYIHKSFFLDIQFFSF